MCLATLEFRWCCISTFVSHPSHASHLFVAFLMSLGFPTFLGSKSSIFPRMVGNGNLPGTKLDI
jgi:hypothetical protein